MNRFTTSLLAVGFGRLLTATVLTAAALGTLAVQIHVHYV